MCSEPKVMVSVHMSIPWMGDFGKGLDLSKMAQDKHHFNASAALWVIDTGSFRFSYRMQQPFNRNLAS